MSELSQIRKSVCDRISDDLEDLVSQVETFRDGVVDDINNVANQILNIVKPFDPYEEARLMDQAISDIAKNMAKIVPAVEDFNEIMDILRECGFLQVDVFLSDPVTLTMQILGYLKSNAMDVLFEITDLVPMLLSRTMQDLIDMIPSVEIAGFEAYALIHCLSAMCGRTDLENSYARLHNAFHDLCMNGKGTFEINRWYSKGGLDINNSLDMLHIENMNKGVGTINNVYRSVESNTNQAIEKFKRSLPL